LVIKAGALLALGQGGPEHQRGFALLDGAEVAASSQAGVELTESVLQAHGVDWKSIDFGVWVGLFRPKWAQTKNPPSGEKAGCDWGLRPGLDRSGGI
jgi:hypothetical protein